MDKVKPYSTDGQISSRVPVCSQYAYWKKKIKILKLISERGNKVFRETVWELHGKYLNKAKTNETSKI